MRKEFVDIEQMQRWLKNVVGVTIVAVGLQGDIGALYSNITSPIALASAIGTSQVYTDCRYDHPCFVEFEPSAQPDPFPELDYERYMAAFFVKVRLASNQKLYGGYEDLMPQLANHGYLVFMNPPEDGFHVGYLLVRMPQDPADIDVLKETLLSKSVAVTVPDGSLEMTIFNTTFGNGLSPNQSVFGQQNI